MSLQIHCKRCGRHIIGIALAEPSREAHAKIWQEYQDNCYCHKYIADDEIFELDQIREGSKVAYWLRPEVIERVERRKARRAARRKSANSSH